VSLPISEWLFDIHFLESRLLGLGAGQDEFSSARIWLDPRKALIGMPAGLFPDLIADLKTPHLPSLLCLQSNLFRAACLTIELRRSRLLDNERTVVGLHIDPDYRVLGGKKGSLLPLGTSGMSQAKKQFPAGNPVARWQDGVRGFGPPGSGKAGLYLVADLFIDKVSEAVKDIKDGRLRMSYFQPQVTAETAKAGRPPRARVASKPASEVLGLLEAQADTLQVSYHPMGEEVTRSRIVKLSEKEGLTEEQRALLKELLRRSEEGGETSSKGKAALPGYTCSALHSSSPESQQKVRFLSPEQLEYRRPDPSGRFHAPFQSALRREERASLTFDGKPTIELDFGSLHPRMLAHLAGMIGLPEDLYPVVEGWPREVVKVAVNVLLNASSPAEGQGAIASRTKESKRARAAVLRLADSVGMGNEADALFRDFGLPRYPADMVKALAVKLRKNPYFGQFLGQSAWRECQQLDSQIAEEVMLDFLRSGNPILSLHDSFIVLAEEQSRLRRVMMEKYQEVVETSESPVVK
jgi:hypothetical protein